MQTLIRSVHCTSYDHFSDWTPNKMDYHQKMVVVSQPKYKEEDDDDEDLEALRLAALQSLKTKDATQTKKQQLPQLSKVVPQVPQPVRPCYKVQRPARRGYFHNRSQQRQNGNMYYQSPRNPNLIAIVPIEEHPVMQQTELLDNIKVEKTDDRIETKTAEISKFHRYKDSGSCSEEEDTKSHKKPIVETIKSEPNERDTTEDNKITIKTEIKSEVEIPDSKNENIEKEEDTNDDDDDVLLMADLEEEDSLERLMDEMEREMNVDKPDKREKRSHRRESRNVAINESTKNQIQKNKTEETSGKKESNNSTVDSSIPVQKNERRSVSPHRINRDNQKRRSLSPKLRSRKRSPRRSPVRQLKKSQRETTRYRSPRMSPLRYSPRSRSPKLSPRPRSPRLSPRRSPNRSPIRRSPLRKLSPRLRSPRLSSPQSRSPRPQRSRSPKVSSRSRSPRPLRSPKISCSRSPRLGRSRSPRFSPHRSPHLKSPCPKSPRQSPRRVPSSRRLSPRLRSPGISPRRSPRLRSPKLSPRRASPRSHTPRASPRRSPWSSPRNSPRLSPRRKRSPRWSPKEISRKRSLTPDSPAGSPLYSRKQSPAQKTRTSPETNRTKTKQRDDHSERVVSTTDVPKESNDTINDPILEARRKKFESTTPIDPINANKKIKLCKKEDSNKKVENQETDIIVGSTRRNNKITEEYNTEEADLTLNASYDFEELEDTMENTSPVTLTASVNSCVELEPPKPDKERSSKKKKKRDKEIYQVGKLKSELPLSERIGKDKKCKKRKEPVLKCTYEDLDTVFEDTNVDEEGDLRAELSRRRAERLNRTVPIQSARLVQSAFKGVVSEVVKSNAKVNQRHIIKNDEKPNQKDIRRVTVLHRSVSDLHDSEDESALDSKVPVLFRLGLNKQAQETRESKASRKTAKRQGRKVKHKTNSSLTDLPTEIL